MRKSIAALLAGAALIGISGTAAARVDVGISLGIPAPVYYAPRPAVVYAPAPVYYAPPAPVYYGPPAYYYGPPGHRHGHHRHWR